MIKKYSCTFFLRYILVSVISLAVFSAGIVCHAQSLFDNDGDDLIFEEDTPLAPVETALENKDLAHTFLNDATFTLGYRLSHGTGSRSDLIDNYPFLRMEYDQLLTSRLFCRFDGRIRVHPRSDHRADAKKRALYPAPHIREAYLSGGGDDVSLKIGKQVSVWGKTDTAAITDVVSPRDRSDFIFTRLEDARLGQWMVSANLYTGGFSSYLFFSPLPETDQEPGAGTQYARPVFPDGQYHITTDTPGFGDMEFGLKLDKTLGQTDISFMTGRFFSNSARYQGTGTEHQAKPVMEKRYPGYTMAGAALSHARQSVLFKAEVAYKHRFPLQGLAPGPRYTILEENLIDASLGFEYNANNRYKVTGEFSSRYLLSGPAYMMPGSDRFSPSLYAAFTKDFFHQTLEFEYSFFAHLKEKNRFHRFLFTWDTTDTIRVKLGYTFFSGGDVNTMMWQYRNEDRISLELALFF